MDLIQQPGRHGLSFILVTFNSAAPLQDFLQSLTAHPPSGEWELVAVDNASADGSPEVVRRGLPRARIIANEQNVGFASAVNQGFEASHGDYVLLVNPDVSWRGPVVNRLAAFLMEHPNAAAVCPRLVYPDGSPQPSVRRFPNYRNIWFSRGSPIGRTARDSQSSLAYTLPDPANPAQVEAASATFLMMRASSFDAIGRMDGNYFLYVEDTDLCRRWHDTGWEVWIDPSQVVTHSWQGGSRRSARLRRLHRQGIKRYFQVHHRRKRFRNALLGLVLVFAGAWDMLRFGRSAQ